MFSKKDNGRLKVNWESLAAFVFILGILISSIVGYKLLEAQSDTTKTDLASVIKNTTEKTEGTLKSDVIENKEILAIHDKKISVLESNQIEMKKIQTETKQAITDLNKKIDSNQRDIMKVLLELKGD